MLYAAPNPAIAAIMSQCPSEVCNSGRQQLTLCNSHNSVAWEKGMICSSVQAYFCLAWYSSLVDKQTWTLPPQICGCGSDELVAGALTDIHELIFSVKYCAVTMRATIVSIGQE